MPEARLEKRSEARLRTSIEATFEDTLKAESVRCTIVDLSGAGFGADAEAYFPVGTVYAFTMKREPAVTVRGQVRWVRSTSAENYRFGVRFVELSSAASLRLTEFLTSKRKAANA